MTIINRQHRFIYLKSRKSAGTSLEAHLLLNTPLGGDFWHTAEEIKKHGLPSRAPRVILPLRASDTPHILTVPAWIDRRWPWRFRINISEHHYAASLRSLLGPFWDSACKATNVRNPWDMLVSAWQWRRDGRAGTSAPIQTEFLEWLDAALSEDVVWQERVGAYDPRRLLNPFLFIDGHACVDVLIRQEAIDAGLQTLGERLGLDLGKLAIREKQSARRKDYRSYFDDARAESVGHFFADVLAITGYTFDPTDAA